MAGIKNFLEFAKNDELTGRFFFILHYKNNLSLKKSYTLKFMTRIKQTFKIYSRACWLFFI